MLWYLRKGVIGSKSIGFDIDYIIGILSGRVYIVFVM